MALTEAEDGEHPKYSFLSLFGKKSQICFKTQGRKDAVCFRNRHL